MRSSLPIAIVFAMLSATVVARAGYAAASSVASCAATNLVVITNENGDDGMMHAALSVHVTNTGTVACAIPAVPVVSLLGADDGVVVPSASPSLLPPRAGRGPALPPRTLAPNASVQFEIRWVHDNGALDHRNCVNAATLVVDGVRAPLATQLCGDDAPNAAPPTLAITPFVASQ